MDVLEENMFTGSSLSVDNDVKNYLLETAKWAKFLSIVGFVILGIIFIAGLFVMMLGNTISSMTRQPVTPVPFAVIGFIYIVMVIVYFFPILFLYKSAVGLKNGIHSNNQEIFKNGLQNLKAHYKFIGILTIIVLSLYILMALFGRMASF